jgi:hypothetical protein
MTMAAGEWARTFAHVSQAMLTESFALCKPSASVLSRYNVCRIYSKSMWPGLSANRWHAGGRLRNALATCSWRPGVVLDRR